MKKILTVMITFLILFSGHVFASESAEKPTLVFIYANNMGKTSPGPNYDDSIKKKLYERFTKSFSPTYNIIIDDKYLRQMHDAGMNDLSSSERADILPFFKNQNISYVVIFEMEPAVIATSLFTASESILAQLKLIDVNNNTYLYNGKFTDSFGPFDSITDSVMSMYKEAVTKVLVPKLLP